MDITRWSTPKSDWLYSLHPKVEKLYIVNKNKTRSWLWLNSWTPYYQIQTEIEESRENARPFRSDQFSSVQSLSRVQLFATPWIAACQTSLSITNYRSSRRLTSIESVMPSRQIWPWNAEWTRAKANRVLPRERTGPSKHPLPTTQEKTLHMDIIRWSILKSDRLYFL